MGGYRIEGVCLVRVRVRNGNSNPNPNSNPNNPSPSPRPSPSPSPSPSPNPNQVCFATPQVTNSFLLDAALSREDTGGALVGLMLHPPHHYTSQRELVGKVCSTEAATLGAGGCIPRCWRLHP